MEASSQHPAAGVIATTNLPRITIQFCTQCKWMLRAAYFAQELLSTFSLSIGEVALIPSTGGIFTIDIFHTETPIPVPSGETKDQEGADGVEKPSIKEIKVKSTRLWDRKVEGGFPETKLLKKLIRDIIDPSRNLGHIDRQTPATSSHPSAPAPPPSHPFVPTPPPTTILAESLTTTTTTPQPPKEDISEARGGRSAGGDGDEEVGKGEGEGIERISISKNEAKGEEVEEKGPCEECP